MCVCGHSTSEGVLSGFRSASKARVLGYGIARTTAQPTQHKRSRMKTDNITMSYIQSSLTAQFQFFGSNVLDCALTAESFFLLIPVENELNVQRSKTYPTKLSQGS